MSIRTIKEENGDYATIIDGFDTISTDPTKGTNRMIQVNLSVPGEVSVGYPITASATSGATLGVPISRATSFTAGSSVNHYILDDVGHVFKSPTSGFSGTWTYLSSNAALPGSANTNDSIIFWNGYLFKFRETNIDYWTGSTWVNGWQTGITTAPHYAISTTDNAIYFCNGQYIGSILYVAGTFSPTDPATYTFNASAHGLPLYDFAVSLAEQSTNLLIGGSLNAIYPWDGITTANNFPIFLSESYIRRMVTANNSVYIFSGNQNGRGRIYITNGTNANLFFKIPDYIFGEQDPYYVFGDVMYHRNNLVWGMFVEHNSGSGEILSSEVWALDLETKAFRSISSIPANATAKANATVLIPNYGASLPGFGYGLAWNDKGSAPGIGYSGTTAGIGSAGIITDLIPVGTAINLKTFKQLEFKLRSPLQTGESILITYLDNNGSGNVGTTNTVGAISDIYPVNFEKSQWLQFQIALTGNSASSGVRLRELRLR